MNKDNGRSSTEVIKKISVEKQALIDDAKNMPTLLAQVGGDENLLHSDNATVQVYSVKKPQNYGILESFFAT